MRTLLISALLMTILVGCSQPYMSEQRLERGLVIVLTGIEGRSSLNEEICDGLNAGGVDWAIRLEDWTSPLGPLYTLSDEANNRDKAERLARRITEYRFDYPGRRVILVGQSGGAGMAAWAVEFLPPGHQVDGIVMLAPSLSPQYMLDQALARSQSGIVNFYSSEDWLLWGTTVTGTMDREFAESAGRVGFVVPRTSDRDLYRRLYQIAWAESMAPSGHTGGHLSSGAEQYVAQYVAPIVLAEEWDQQLISAIAAKRAEQPSAGGTITPFGMP